MLRHVALSLALFTSLLAAPPAVEVEGDLVYFYTYEPDSERVATKATYDGGHLFSDECFEYDRHGNVVFESYTDASLHLVKRREWVWDDGGWVKNTSQYYVEDGQERLIKTRTTRYDLQGYPAEVETCQGSYSFVRNDEGRVVREMRPGGIIAEWAYDERGKVVMRSINGRSERCRRDPNTGTMTWAADALGREYFYDSNKEGDILHWVCPPVRTPDGWLCPEYHRTCDQWGLVTSETDPLGRTQHLEYDDEDQVRKIVTSDEVIYFERDGFGRVVRESHVSPNGYPRSQIINVYSGRLQTSSEERPGQKVVWTYDPRGLKVSACRDGVFTYWTHDECGRIIEKRTPSETYRYEYGEAGNVCRLLKEDENGLSEGIFDLFERVVRETDHTGRVITFEYEETYRFEGQRCYCRHQTDCEGEVLTQIWDGDMRLLREELRDASGTLIDTRDCYYNLAGERVDACS